MNRTALQLVGLAFSLALSSCSVEANFDSKDGQGGQVIGDEPKSGGAQSLGGNTSGNGGAPTLGGTVSTNGGTPSFGGANSGGGNAATGGKVQGTLPLGSRCSLVAQDCQPTLGCYHTDLDANGQLKGQCMYSGSINEGATCPMYITGPSTQCRRGSGCFPDSDPNASTGTCYRFCNLGSGATECSGGLYCNSLDGVFNVGICFLKPSSRNQE